MKSHHAYMAALFIAATAMAGLDQDKTLNELDKFHARMIDTCPKAGFENAILEHVDDFLEAMSNLKELIEEKAKNKLGGQDENFKKAIKQLDTRTKEIVVILRALKGTKTPEGLKSLKDLLKEHEERLADAEKKLAEVDFDKDDKKDDKKKGVELLSEAVYSLKALIKKMNEAAEAKIKLLKKPVKKRPLKAKKDAKDEAKSDSISEQDEDDDLEFELFFEMFLLEYQVELSPEDD